MTEEKKLKYLREDLAVEDTYYVSPLWLLDGVDEVKIHRVMKCLTPEGAKALEDALAVLEKLDQEVYAVLSGLGVYDEDDGEREPNRAED